MKKTYLKSAVATFGILASTTLAINGQSAGGAGAGGAGAAGSGTVGGNASIGGSTARATTPGVRVGNQATTGGLNTAGAAGINQPSTTPPIGGASVTGPTPNAVGGSASGNTILSSPNGVGTAGATATLPAGGSSVINSIPAASLPGPVQSVLQSYGANGSLGSISQIQGANGPIYRANVTQNGVPVELQISRTGQILSRNVGVTSTGPITAASEANPTSTSTTTGNLGNFASGTLQAGLPVSSLPQPVQTSIQSQLGANAQVQSVSQDDLANGSIYRVTANRNGVPTEMRFAANGTLLSATPLNGSATSTISPTTGAVVPGTSVVLDQLPAQVQTAVQEKVGSGKLNQIRQMPGADGMTYIVSYDANGRPMLITVGQDGRIINERSLAAPGSTANRASATPASSNTSTNKTNARASVTLDDLPDDARKALEDKAPQAEVRSISREKRVSGDVYVVSVREKDSVGEITFDENGKILTDTRRNFADFTAPQMPVDEDQPVGIPYNKVPVAIQNAIKAYAAASDIRSITLGLDRDNRAAYDVVFYRDGRRDRMVIAKDGTLKRIDQNVSFGSVQGLEKNPRLAIGDLPQQVQDTIRRQTENVLIKDVGVKQVGTETFYQVTYETNGSPVELLVANDGKVVLPQGGSEIETANTPLPAPVRKDELPSARVVATSDRLNTAANNGRSSSIGTAAQTERGTVDSIKTAEDVLDRKNESSVRLSDAPVSVQKAAKKIVGTGTIDSITPRLQDSGVVYEVNYTKGGTSQSELLNKDGVVIKK